MCCTSSTGVLLGHHVSDWRLSKMFDAKNDNKATGLSSHYLFALWRVWTLEKSEKNLVKSSFNCELKIIWTPMCCTSSTGVLLGHHVSDWRLSKTFDAKNDNKATGLSSHCLFALWRVWTLQKKQKKKSSNHHVVTWKKTNILKKSQIVLSSSAAGNWKKTIFFRLEFYL